VVETAYRLGSFTGAVAVDRGGFGKHDEYVDDRFRRKFWNGGTPNVMEVYQRRLEDVDERRRLAFEGRRPGTHSQTPHPEVTLTCIRPRHAAA
jgi:hypothetical protein